MDEERWTYQDYTVIEAPESTSAPFTYVYRVERGGSEVFRYTIMSDADSIRAHWPDMDPARSTDMEGIWGSLASLGFARVRAKIDASDLTSCTLRLSGAAEVEE